MTIFVRAQLVFLERVDIRIVEEDREIDAGRKHPLPSFRQSTAGIQQHPVFPAGQASSVRLNYSCLAVISDDVIVGSGRLGGQAR